MSEPERAQDPPRWTGSDLVRVLLGGIVGVFVTAFVMGIFVGVLDLRFSPAEDLIVASALVYLPFCLSGWHYLVRKGKATWEQLAVAKASARTLALMFPLALGTLVVQSIVVFLTLRLSGSERDNLSGLPSAPGTSDLVLLLVAAALFAPIAEEFVFRGVLHTFLRQRIRRVPATLASSAIFAVAHYVPLVFPGLFVTGIVLAVVRDATESLFPPMVLHGAINAAVILLFAAA